MVQILREEHPRLYHPVDDPDYRFDPPEDAARKRILKNILADCEIFYFQRPWKRIPERPHSPHPYHQLYLTFYTGMHATALIEHYAFAWRLTGETAHRATGLRSGRGRICGCFTSPMRCAT